MTFWIDVGLLFVFAFGALVGWWARGLWLRVRLNTDALIHRRRKDDPKT